MKLFFLQDFESRERMLVIAPDEDRARKEACRKVKDESRWRTTDTCICCEVVLDEEEGSEVLLHWHADGRLEGDWNK